MLWIDSIKVQTQTCFRQVWLVDAHSGRDGREPRLPGRHRPQHVQDGLQGRVRVGHIQPHRWVPSLALLVM